ncbi:hypothetical protein CYOC110262_10510 [Cytobacillus oceanisediminis]|uniref:Uncharacterized protein n=1 Tax=Cytobacillus oceanisediminis TaxID=665099 RepID=A0A562K2L9_9BACI|nr:hypothetical protein IQ19_00910 [Cytobacillus oceanisediminis]
MFGIYFFKRQRLKWLFCLKMSFITVMRAVLSSQLFAKVLHPHMKAVLSSQLLAKGLHPHDEGLLELSIAFKNPSSA